MAILTCHHYQQPDELYISSDLHKWTRTRLQYQNMSLTVYQSKFVLVGGRHPSTREPTSIVLTSTTGQQWEPSLPPMSTERYHTSSVSTTSPEVLVVAGGVGSDDKKLDVVEVLMDNKWTTADSFHAVNSAMDSTLHDGNLYFTSGAFQDKTMYTCSCASLISSCEKSSSNTSNSQLWREFHAPAHRTTALSYSLRLVNINGRGTVSCYSSIHDSWIEATSEGDRPRHYSWFTTARVLPTGDIVFAHDDDGIYRITVSGKYICTYVYYKVMYMQGRCCTFNSNTASTIFIQSPNLTLSPVHLLIGGA